MRIQLESNVICELSCILDTILEKNEWAIPCDIDECNLIEENDPITKSYSYSNSIDISPEYTDFIISCLREKKYTVIILSNEINEIDCGYKQVFEIKFDNSTLRIYLWNTQYFIISIIVNRRRYVIIQISDNVPYFLQKKYMVTGS